MAGKTQAKKQFDEDTRTAELYEQEVKDEEKRANLSRVNNLNDELKPYSDGMAYDRDRVMHEIRFYMKQTVEGIIETGKRLVILKEKEEHGRFINCVEELGIARMTAWRFMAITKKLANVSRVRHLNILDMKKGIGKLYAFLDIPDDELKEFEDTGELRGLTIDEIDALPVKELKLRLRKRDKQAEQGVLQLQEAGDKIKDLERQILEIQKPKLYSSEEEKYLDIISELGMQFEQILMLIQARIGYDKNKVPQEALKKLFYLLLFMQRETMDERVRLCQFYEGANDVPWEPMPMELPPDDVVNKNVPHLSKIANYRKAKSPVFPCGNKEGPPSLFSTKKTGGQGGKKK